MKFLVFAILLSCIFTDSCVAEVNFEERCEINGIVETQLRLIFGVNINFSYNLIEIFTRRYEQLELMYLAYHDNFRRLYQDNQGNERANWRSRVDYYFQRLRLATQEMIKKANTGQYVIDAATRTITFSFDCPSSPHCSCGKPIRYDQSHCSGGIEFYDKTECVAYTQRVPENSDSRTLSSEDLIALRGVVSQLYDARFTHDRCFETLKARLMRFFRMMHIVRIHRRVSRQTGYAQYSYDTGGLDVDVNLLIMDKVYFEENIRRPEMWFNDDLHEINVISQDQDHSSDAEKGLAQNSSILMGSFCSETQGLLRRMDTIQNLCIDMDSHDRALYGFDIRPCFSGTVSERKNPREKDPRTTVKPNSSKRSRRSAPKIKTYGRSQSIDKIIRHSLMDFVLVSLIDQTEANYLNQKLQWFKDFDELYDQFSSGNWANLLCQNSTIGFDNFLYSRLQQHPVWLKCTSRGNRMSDERCLAVKRIFLKGKSSWLNQLSRTQKFLKDRVTIYKMLNEIPSFNQTSTNTKMSAMIGKKENKTDNVYINEEVFNLISMILTFAQVNSCYGKP